jgi:hypothetical protein
MALASTVERYETNASGVEGQKRTNNVLRDALALKAEILHLKDARGYR